MVSSEAVHGERDQLMGEVTPLKKESDGVRLAILEYEADPEWKDDYIEHLSFLLEPHHDLLP